MGRSHGSPTACVSSRRGRSQRSPAGVNASVRLQLVLDRFIAGLAECSLRRHLDSEEPDTPSRDIVDRCRVWESHAEDTDKWGVGCRSERLEWSTKCLM